MDDVQQMLLNEIQRLDKAIEKRTKALSKIDEQTKLRTMPKRYVLEYAVPAGENVLNIPISRSFVVDKDCLRFVCQEIVCSVAAVGRITGVANSNKLTLAIRESFLFDFNWQIRDTSTDREWQNVPLPKYFLASGLTAGVPLSRGAAVKAGTEVELVLVPTSSRTVSSSFDSIESYTVQISFVGYEVL